MKTLTSSRKAHTDEASFVIEPPYSERSLAIACTRGRQAVVSHFQKLLADAKLTEQQWRTLRIIYDYGPIGVADVCRYSCIHKVSMGRIIKALMERGIVDRTRNPNDQRAYDVMLTTQGKAMLDQMTPEASRISRQIAERFGEEKSALLLSLLRELAELRSEG